MITIIIGEISAKEEFSSTAAILILTLIMRGVRWGMNEYVSIHSLQERVSLCYEKSYCVSKMQPRFIF